MKSLLGILYPISNPSPNHFCAPPTPTPTPMPSFTTHPSPSLSVSLALHHPPRPPRLLSLTPPPLGLRLPPLRRPPALLFSFTASHDDSSKPSGIDVEKATNDLEKEADEPQDAWKETLSSFKEQALKMQTVSQEAYQVYSDKARVILKETSEKLKVQAEKARQELTVIASEISEESKEYLSNAADISPEPVKDIVETFASSTDDLKEVSKVRDFYLGIPYGSLLFAGGFLSFMFTGSVSAVRFGVILGGTLLALSISSLRSWKKGESSSLALKGQAAICAILFLREVRLLFCRPFIANFITAFVSGVVVAFYAYRIIMDREQAQGSNLERGTES